MVSTKVTLITSKHSRDEYRLRDLFKRFGHGHPVLSCNTDFRPYMAIKYSQYLFIAIIVQNT